jgi:predicted N-acetyltransferase YhbS
MEFRSCTAADRLAAIALSRSVFKPNMGEQFPALFGENNMNHMFLAVDHDRVVSMVNYYPATVLIHGARISTGSIGSVCTHPDYRGKKIASRLLAMAGDQMRAEGISLMIISGHGNLYSAYGADYAGNVTEWFVPRGMIPVNPEIVLAPFHEADWPTMIRVYETEPVRFLRQPTEFQTLFRGQTFPDEHKTYPTEWVLRNGKAVAYAILDLSDDPGDDTLGIKEYAGDRMALSEAFDKLLEKYGRKRMHFAVDPHDPLQKIVAGGESRSIHQYASLKIMDFPALMDQLKPYWAHVVPEMANSLRYEEILGTFRFLCGDELLDFSDEVALTRFVFGFPGQSEPESALGKRLGRVFPIPFPWTHNLNYQ